jgi:outer membrane protein assembly factor BamB
MISGQVTGLVMATTENDSIYAFNAANGREVWKARVGNEASVYRASNHGELNAVWLCLVRIQSTQPSPSLSPGAPIDCDSTGESGTRGGGQMNTRRQTIKTSSTPRIAAMTCRVGSP